MTRRAGLVAACAAAAIVIVEAAILRLGVAGPGAPPLPDRLLPVLAATALLLAAFLALPRSAAFAWAAATAAAAIGTLEVITVVRSLDGVAAGRAGHDLVALATLALIFGAAIGAGYGGRHWPRASRLARGAAVVTGAGLVATIVAAFSAVAAAGQPPVDAPLVGQLTPLRLATRVGLATIAGGFLVGLAADLGGPARRAFERWRADSTKPADRRLWRFVELLADELLSWRVADRRHAAEDERARLAADLHALVLPELRRAAATAEAKGMPAEVQVDLRRALEDVEQLTHERQSIVLEQFGLVAALEWLAERTEERSQLRVELELDGEVPDRPGAIDPAAARAAFRIALLALDNVVRHASATTATIRVTANPEALRLEVLDNGAGTVSDNRNGRGIGDMRAAAAASGGTVEVTLGDRSRVEAAWASGSRRA